MNRIVQWSQMTLPLYGLLPLHYNTNLATAYTSWQICNINAASAWVQRWTPGGGNRASPPPPSYNGALSLKGCVVTGPLTEACNKLVRPLRPMLIGLSFNVTMDPILVKVRSPAMTTQRRMGEVCLESVASHAQVPMLSTQG